MVALSVCDDEGIAVFPEVNLERCHYGIRVVPEVDADDSAVCTADLVEKARGLSEVYVLGVLSDLRKLYGI